MNLVAKGFERIVPARRVLDAIASMPDEEARDVVRSLPAEDLLILARTQSHTDALVLIEYADNEQVQRLLDLDAWEGDQLAPERVFAWLATLAEVSYEREIDFLREVDPEVPALAVMKRARVVDRRDLDEGEVDMDEDLEEALGTPDQQFLLIVPRDDPALPALRALVDKLYAADFDKARTVLQAARWELPTSLEEDCLRFRNARLEEMGFPSVEDAWRAFRPFSDEEEAHWMGRARLADVSTPHERLTDVLLASFRQRAGDALSQAVEGLGEDERFRFLQGAVFLANKVLVARGDSPGEPAAVGEAMGLVADWMRIALDVYGPTFGPAGLLGSVHPEILFRVGATRVTRLAERARRILSDLGSVRAAEVFGNPLQDFLEHLLQPIPAYARSGATRTEVRPFRGLSDVDEARELLDVVGRRARFFADLLATVDVSSLFAEGRDEGVEGAGLTIQRVVATALANRAIGREWTLEPLSRDDLVGLGWHLVHGAQPGEQPLRALILEEFEEYVAYAYGSEGQAEGWRAALLPLVREALGDLEAAAASAAEGGPDLAGLLVRVTPAG